MQESEQTSVVLADDHAGELRFNLVDRGSQAGDGTVLVVRHQEAFLKMTNVE